MNKWTMTAIAAWVLGAVTLAQPAPSPTNADFALAPEPIASPAGADSSEPQVTTGGGRALLSWVETAGTHTSLKFAERAASGWSEARTAASGDDFMVNASDVPSVRRLADGSLVAHWLQQDGPDAEAYKLRIAWSSDEGRSWSASITPHRDKVKTQHGFGSLFQVPGSGLGLVWLDGRAIPPDAPEGAGNMALRAATFDVTGKPLAETIVDSRVCDCCPTAVAATADGIIAAYRNRSAGEVRDIYVTRLVNGKWTPPVAVHNDGWVIRGCPVNGPAIAAHEREVVVAWFTAKGGAGRAFAAFSHDGGRTFGAPVRVDDKSSLGHMGIEILDDGSAVATWVEPGGQGQPSGFMTRRVDSRGQRGPAMRIAASSGTRIPRVARSGDELLFAWTESAGNSSQVRMAHARIH